MSETFALEKVEVALTPQARFDEYLSSRGKRNSRPRREIMEYVFSRHEHFDAEDLEAHFLQQKTGTKSKKVSRPTIYRTLNELVDAGLLRQMPLRGRTVYEHDYGYPQHDHLYCQKCEKLIEFSNASVKQIAETVARQHHFRPLGHRLIVFGVCAECSRPKRPSRRVDLI